MTATDATVQKGHELGQMIQKHDFSAVEKLHQQLVENAESEERIPRQQRQHLQEQTLKAISEQLVQSKVLPDVKLLDGEHQNKFTIVGTTADTGEPGKKEGLVIAIGRKDSKHAESVVILGRDGKFHEAQVVVGNNQNVAGYRIKEGGATWENEAKLKQQFCDSSNQKHDLFRWDGKDVKTLNIPGPAGCTAKLAESGAVMWTKDGSNPPQIMQVASVDHKVYRVSRETTGQITGVSYYDSVNSLKDDKPYETLGVPQDGAHKHRFDLDQNGVLTVSKILLDGGKITAAWLQVNSPDGSRSSRELISPVSAESELNDARNWRLRGYKEPGDDGRSFVLNKDDRSGANPESIKLTMTDASGTSTWYQNGSWNMQGPNGYGVEAENPQTKKKITVVVNNKYWTVRTAPR